MRLVLAMLGIALASHFALADDVYVHGYERKDGTYVEPYYRTAPNSTPTDNYSYKGNVNPYTGKVGGEDNQLWSGHDGYGNRQPSYR